MVQGGLAGNGAGAIAVGHEIAARYVVEALLGRGGMGAVYRVLDRVLGERVALKTLTLDSDVERDRFLREVRLARRITHKNVARTYDFGADDGLEFLTMELLEGPSLRTLMRSRGKLPEAEAVSIAAQIAEGLAAAHEADIVHRDLKPGNVIVLANGRAVIVDFGIARASTDEALTSGVVGTPAFMAPEQLGGAKVDARTDLYALGLILHEMLSGSLPVWGQAPNDLLARITSEEPPVLALGEACPALQALVGRLLARAPAERPGSAREVLAELSARSAIESELTRPESPRLASVGTRRAPAAPLPDAARALAVLPFKERHGTEPGLGSVTAEELVDTLSRLRGLRVLAARASSRFGPDADPRELGRDLGVDFVVEGSVQQHAGELRVTARLIEVTGCTQIWSERFDGRPEDVLAFQEQIGQRIAEALRLKLEIVADLGTGSCEAIELYLLGRRRSRELQLAGEEGAVALLERVLDQAPHLRPAIGAVALASVRLAFSSFGASAPDLIAKAKQAVERALELAPELPETELAAGRLAALQGDYVAAARHLSRAVTIAPTCAEAQEYLGHLQCETGRASEGVKRLTLSLGLDPLLLLAPVGLARHHLLHGRRAEFERQAAAAEERAGVRDDGVVLLMRLRAAAWSGDLAELQRLRARLAKPSLNPGYVQTIGLYVDYLTRTEIGPDEDRALAEMPGAAGTARLATLLHQLAAEAFGLRGKLERCLEQLELATRAALLDHEWLELCPALAEARKAPTFPEIERRVRARADTLWTI